MMNNDDNISFTTPEEWMKYHRNKLDKYSGEWIAFNKDGIVAHNKDGRITWDEARQKNVDYVLKYVHPSEIPRVIRIVPIRVRSLKGSKWQPDYPITLSTSMMSEKLLMLVDSGADITVIPKWVGDKLGLNIDENDYIEKAEGINGAVDYVIRNLTFEIDGHNFKAPVGWIQTESVEDILLGREVVFDIFDVEFKQKDEAILFKKRKEFV